MMKVIPYNAFKILIVTLCFFTITLYSQQDYIKVNGTNFTLDGKQYHFVGTNFWYGCYIGSTGETGDRQRLIRELDRLKEIGINNLRILGASELSNSQNSIKPAIQISAGIYNDSLLIGLDFLLSEMSKRNMHAVIFLNNFWDWSGGMGQYNSWFGGSSFDASGFYRNIQAKEAFKNFISDLINRQNSITGLHYYEDPTIMTWQLANEPRPGFSSAYIDSFYKWIDETAEYIHSLDTNHLVTTGNEGTKGSLESGNIYLRAHQSEYIDYATIHVWALNWGWINPDNMQGTYANALLQAGNYIKNHIGYARQLNKPLTMEEFGMPRDGGNYDTASSTSIRDQYFNSLLKLIYDSAATGSPIVGSNFWGWGGEGRSPNSDFRWRVGDPFVCDPPMEAQGLNSIFDSDTSTINILKKYADLMANLRESTAVNENNITYNFQLYQNYPNPFNPSTIIQYSLIKPSNVKLTVYNLFGEQIKTLINHFESSGFHLTAWDGKDDKNNPVSSGIYFYRLQVADLYLLKKMTLVR